MGYTIQFKRGTSAQWTSQNPVLADGEPALETDTGKIKIGDGTTEWGDLLYLAGDGGGGTTAYNLDGGKPDSNYGGIDPISGGGV